MFFINDKIKKPILGNIKLSADDFIVEEITNNNTILEKDKFFDIIPFNEINAAASSNSENHKFTLFILQKKNWNTIQALTEIARKLNRTFKSAGFAGTKDRLSISTQLCTLFGVNPDQVLNVNIKDIKINGAWPINNKIELGNLLGNKFTIKIKNTKVITSLNEALKNLENLGNVFPNYFGEQRFGNRNNNYLIGIDILKGDFEEAALKFLTDTQNEFNEDAKEARIKLFNEGDFADALNYFPKYLKYERLVLQHLSKLPNDYANALRKLPRSLSLLFMHSVDAFFFNKELEIYVKNQDLINDNKLFCNSDIFGFPDLNNIFNYSQENINKKNINKKFFAITNLIGYNSKLNELEKELLEEFNINQEMFKTKRMPELHCKGSYRLLFSPFYNFEFKEQSKEQENNFIVFKFSLPKSSYATTFLMEFVSIEEK